jgi:glycosyltransferase involved in cell wall biosynthesis
VSPDINAVIVTNVPPPYRIPAWRLVAQTNGINLELVFCAQPHIDTSISPEEYGFRSHFLKGRYHIMDQRFMHFDFGVWSLLNDLKPDVLITTGYIPTFLIAFIWAVVNRTPHIAMTDGTFNSEKPLTVLHRIVRSIVYRYSAVFIGACEGSRQLFQSYGVDPDRIHLSYLCTENLRFSCKSSDAKSADFIFCGRFIALKRPLFVLQIALGVAKLLGRKVVVHFVGSGDMEQKMRLYASEIEAYVESRFLGYATQAELPGFYSAAKIFLFPTENDTWGVVANEACASGLPVIVSPYAGVANELIIDGENGFVCELQESLWVNAAVKLLSDDDLYQRFSKSSRERVTKYSFENAAKGMVQAIHQAGNFRKIQLEASD